MERESMAKFYGKRGMSWHGTVCFYRNGDEEPTVDLKTGERKENLSVIYIDHICGNDRMQDRLAICSILDAVLFHLRTEFTEAKKISIQWISFSLRYIPISY